MAEQAEVTQILSQIQGGNRDAVRRLLPMVYEQLRQLAEQYLRRERGDHTLQATALVHEAFLKLVGQQHARFENRAHFFAVAAQAMRRILVDYARAHLAAKRGGDVQRISLQEISTVFQMPEADLLTIDSALDRLSEKDELQGRIVELRFFGGLTVEETATVLQISPSKVNREWQMAKAWLHREVKGD